SFIEAHRGSAGPSDTVRLGEEIALIAIHIDAATHRLLTLIREFDEKGGWQEQNALSCAHWLQWRIGLDSRTARDKVRVAHALGGLPEIDAALKAGKVSYSKVRAITRVATAETESTLLAVALHGTTAQLENVCRHFERAISTDAAREARRFVSSKYTEFGPVRITAELLPEEAAVVMKALEAARVNIRESGSAEPPTRRTSTKDPEFHVSAAGSAAARRR